MPRAQRFSLIDAPDFSPRPGRPESYRENASVFAMINPDTSTYWLRHSHTSHALDRGASLVTVRDTPGHSSVAVTDKYLHSTRKDGSIKTKPWLDNQGFTLHP